MTTPDSARAGRDDHESAAARITALEAEIAALRARRFSTLDGIGLAITAFAVGGVGLLFPIFVRPRFAAIFADFGGSLPRVTLLVLDPWFMPVVALVPAALVVAALARRTAGAPARRGLVIAAFLVAGLQAAFFWWALYAPLYALADGIRAD